MGGCQGDFIFAASVGEAVDADALVGGDAGAPVGHGGGYAQLGGGQRQVEGGDGAGLQRQGFGQHGSVGVGICAVAAGGGVLQFHGEPGTGGHFLRGDDERGVSGVVEGAGGGVVGVGDAVAVGVGIPGRHYVFIADVRTLFKPVQRQRGTARVGACGERFPFQQGDVQAGVEVLQFEGDAAVVQRGGGDVAQHVG